MATFTPTEVRASEVARGCDRMSVLRALGHTPAEPGSEEREWFARGHLFEHYVVSQLEAKHGKENVIRQPEIHHPLGVGHSDALVVPERLLVEVKSTVAGTLTTPVFENGVRQLKIGIRYHDGADEGALYMINPSTLKPADVFRVVLTDEDAAEIDETFRDIGDHILANSLPDRVCSKPSNGRGYLCPLIAACFDGWEPDPDAVVSDPRALDAAARWHQAKADERRGAATVREAEAARKEAAAELADYVDEGDTLVGPYKVRRWHVNGRTSFSVKAAEAAGVPHELLEPYITETDGYDRIEVAPAAVSGEVDYGQVPF